MKKVESKRSILKFYASIIFGLLFFITLGITILWIFDKELSKGDIKSKLYILPLVSLASFYLAFYTVYKYIRNAPSIKIDTQNITIGNESYSWLNLKKIDLTGKWNFPYLISMPMEAFCIQFNDGTTKIIFDDMYSNTWEIKTFIQKVIIDKKDFKPNNSVEANSDEIQFEKFETYKGNPFFSLRGLSLWIMIGFFLTLLLLGKKTPSTSAFIFFGLFGTFWFMIHSYLMNYFKCSNKYFVVKNHNYLWKNKVFKLSEIKEIVFESHGKQPNCLRIITEDFRNKFYPAGTLKDSTWLELKRKLEKNNIVVRNECIFEE